MHIIKFWCSSIGKFVASSVTGIEKIYVQNIYTIEMFSLSMVHVAERNLILKLVISYCYNITCIVILNWKSV